MKKLCETQKGEERTGRFLRSLYYLLPWLVILALPRHSGQEGKEAGFHVASSTGQATHHTLGEGREQEAIRCHFGTVTRNWAA